MEEFDKWWEKVLNMHWSHYDKGVCWCAWKAALEWVLSEGIDEDWLEDTIKEELNAKT